MAKIKQGALTLLSIVSVEMNQILSWSATLHSSLYDVMIMCTPLLSKIEQGECTHPTPSSPLRPIVGSRWRAAILLAFEVEVSAPPCEQGVLVFFWSRV